MQTLLVRETEGRSGWAELHDYAILLGGRLATVSEVIQWLDGRPYSSSHAHLWVPVLVNLVDKAPDWVQIADSNYGKTFSEIHGLSHLSETGLGHLLVTFTDHPRQLGENKNPPPVMQDNSRPVIVIEPSSVSSSEEREPEPEPQPEPLPVYDSTISDSPTSQKKVITSSFTKTEETDEDIITTVVTTTTVTNPQNRTKTITTKKDKTIMNKSTGKIAVLEDDECPMVTQSFSTTDEGEGSTEHLSVRDERYLKEKKEREGENIPKMKRKISINGEKNGNIMLEERENVSTPNSKNLQGDEDFLQIVPILVETISNARGSLQGEDLNPSSQPKINKISNSNRFDQTQNSGRNVLPNSGLKTTKSTVTEGIDVVATSSIDSNLKDGVSSLVERSGNETLGTALEEREEETRPGYVPIPENPIRQSPDLNILGVTRGENMKSGSTSERESLGILTSNRGERAPKSPMSQRSTRPVQSPSAERSYNILETDKSKKPQYTVPKRVEGIQTPNTRSRAGTTSVGIPLKIPTEVQYSSRSTEQGPKSARRRSVSTYVHPNQSTKEVRYTTTVTEEESWVVVVTQEKLPASHRNLTPSNNTSKLSTNKQATVVTEEVKEWNLPGKKISGAESLTQNTLNNTVGTVSPLMEDKKVMEPELITKISPSKEKRSESKPVEEKPNLNRELNKR
eukprot:TRINITY_DN3558_c0_g1_i1.p1 TRINITY_DN3558_c0_g1~~TRINITY_DN3558_c0_g1_i1.p1  ORF type:complete len:705 (+),score=138.58 TRINITY_DN3558_c0_g1_i1:72-2117(+)